MNPEDNASMQQQMASPEQRQQLMDMMDAVRGKIGELNSVHFATQNAADMSRREALKEVFSALQEAGIDLSDPAAVSEFLDKLRQMNPELARLLEESLDALLGEEQPMNNMNENYEALPEDVRGPVPQNQGAIG